MEMQSAYPGYKLGNCGGKGEGVFATQDFKRNDVVMVGKALRQLDANTPWATQVDIDKFILRDGLASKVNHSCSPNVGYRVAEHGGVDYVAFHDIKVGEEIVTDYAMGNYIIQYMPECKCMSKECRGKISGWRDLPKVSKENYRGYCSDYLWKMP